MFCDYGSNAEIESIPHIKTYIIDNRLETRAFQRASREPELCAGKWIMIFSRLLTNLSKPSCPKGTMSLAPDATCHQQQKINLHQRHCSRCRSFMLLNWPLKTPLWCLWDAIACANSEQSPGCCVDLHVLFGWWAATWWQIGLGGYSVSCITSKLRRERCEPQ